ncbi:MAG: hypothetical protein KAW14_04260 [Candidatus Aegiribacteria sp.]|nr:hypothetical protein [Candidatus Aegiribacteria sp.]
MEHGIVAEDVLENICHRMFGCDFVLRSPVLHEPSGDKELTDVLILLDDIAISIQSKSMLINIDEINDIVLQRIKKRYIKAKYQLNQTLNAHMRESDVSGCTPLDIRIKIDWGYIKHRIGLVTLHLRDNLYNDPEARFQIPYAIEDHRGIVVHTFLLNDLAQMQNELFSAADFIRYLQIREQVWRKQSLFILGNELDFLAAYKTQYDVIEAYLNDEIQGLSIQPGLWEDYITEHQEKIEDRKKRFSKSWYIEYFIRELNTAVQHGIDTRSLSYQDSAQGYLRIIGKLGKLTRMERTEIGIMLEKKIEKTQKALFGYCLYYSKSADIAYLFLLVNDDDRERRLAFLAELGDQACRRLECKELVGIATAGAKMKSSSIDAALFDVDMIRATEPDQDVKQLFGDSEYKRINEWDS